MEKNECTFGNPVEKVIRKRCSWRSYQSSFIDDATMQQINDYILGLPAPPFKTETRFDIVDAGLEGQGRVPGTYGVIKGAKQFIVGVVKKNDKYLEDYGYQFEKIVLCATDLDLATCWIGGTLKHTIFAEKVGMAADELVPAISPVGYGTKRRTISDTLMVMGAGSKKRKPWKDLFFLGNFTSPLNENDAGSYQLPLEMVRLAPSSSNKQPWRIVKEGHRLHFYLQRTTKAYDVLIKSDLQRVDMGIAMCHFELSAIEKGLKGKWEIAEPDITGIPENTEYVTTWVGEE